VGVVVDRVETAVQRGRGLVHVQDFPGIRDAVAVIEHLTEGRFEGRNPAVVIAEATARGVAVERIRPRQELGQVAQSILVRITVRSQTSIIRCGYTARVEAIEHLPPVRHPVTI